MRKNQPKRADVKEENQVLWEKLEELRDSLDDLFEEDEADQVEDE